MSKSIGLLLPDLRGGGAERVMIDLSREFVRIGHNVEFILIQATGDFLPEAARECSIIDLAAARVRSAVLPLVGYLRCRKPDALVVAMWPLTTIAPLAARSVGYRGTILVSEHAMLSLQYRDWGPIHWSGLNASTFLGYRLADARVGVSDGTCRDMAAVSSMTLASFTTIHNPVRQFAASDARVLAGALALWQGHGPRVLTVGSLKAVKNHSLLLRAFARLDWPDARLMLVGQGQGEAALRSLAADLGVANRVIFAGFHADPSQFYATADLFVLSSDHEGFGNVIVEALSFGLPVVSTDCPSGPAGILENGRYGRLVPVGDVEALARVMDEALDAPVDHDALKRRAADFAPEVAARKYLDLLGLS
jgi:glycosyltransferase involved in cell wall biosynthesis